MKLFSRLLFPVLFLLAFIPQTLLAGEPDPEIEGRALSAWTKDLTDPKAGLRALAAAALGEAGTAAAPAAAVLVVALEDDAKPVREAALAALASIGPAGMPHLERRLALRVHRLDAQLAISHAGHRAVPLLIALLESGSWHVRLIACANLRDLGTRATAARDAVTARLSDPSAAVRLKAVAALHAIGGEGLIDLLARALEDEHPLVRLSALDSVALLDGGGQKRVGILVEAARSEHRTVRLIAIHGLCREGPEEALRGALIDEWDRVRVQAAMGLFSRGERDRAIADAIVGGHHWNGALGGIGFLRRGHRNLRALGGGHGHRLPSPPKDQEVAEALVTLASNSVPGLVGELKSESPIARWNAIWLLAEIGGEHARELVPVLESEHEIDRRMAGILLARFPDHRAAAAAVLVSAFVEICTDGRYVDPVIGDWSVDREELEKATRLLGKEAIPHLKAHLVSLDEYRRQSVQVFIEELSK